MEVNDVLQVRIFSTLNAQTAINVLHYFAENKVGTGATVQQAADSFAGIFGPLLKPLMSSLASYRGIGAQTITTIPASIELYSTTTQGAGTVIGDPLPFQVSGIITKRTNFGGRAFRGRFYMPFPGEGDSTALGVPAVGYMTTLALLGTQMLASNGVGAGGNTNLMTPCIFHRESGLFTKLTSMLARPKWATQRRRGNYGQPNVSPI